MKKLIYSKEDLDLILSLEIEEYKEIEKSLNKECEEKDKEIEKLNNIINELEKWLKEYKIQCKKYDSNSTIIVINCILDKLKELKEGKE